MSVKALIATAVITLFPHAVNAEPADVNPLKRWFQSAPAPYEPESKPAATIEVDLAPETRAVVYVPQRAIAYTVPGPVPAELDLLLFVVKKNAPLAVFPVAPLQPGSSRRIDATGPGVESVIGWLSVAEEDRAVLAKEGGLNAPAVRVTSSEGSREADPLPRLVLLHGALVRSSLPPGRSAEWTIGGRGWIPDGRTISITSPLTIVQAPLQVRAAGNLVVNWSAGMDVPALDRSLGACDREEKPPKYEITISACKTPRRGERPDPSDCTIVRQESFEQDASYGTVTLENIAPGPYRAELKFGKLPPISRLTAVLPLQQREVNLIGTYNEIYGSVLYGGEPLGEDVEIRFPNGYGFATAKTSEYRAALIGWLDGEQQVSVSACDGTPQEIVITDRDARRKARFDIDIPANEIAINVTDTFTREPLPATVRFSAMTVLRPKRVVLAKTINTTSDGQASIVAVPEREIRLSIASPGYERQEIAPFTMEKSGTKTIDVQLVPLRGSHGTIVSSRPFDNAAIYWYGDDGYETERAELSPDGTFVYAKSHEEGERMVVVSQSHPLWILRPPVVGKRQTITLPFPDAAPVQDLEVSLASGSDGIRIVGLVIGGLRVPQPVLAHHQGLRRAGTQVSARDPLLFRDLAVTGSFDVLLGPRYEEVPTRAGGMDFFALPQYAESPRVRMAPGANSVTIGQ